MAIKSRLAKRKTRTLLAESLERRAMMAADVAHNFLFPHDVDDDGSVTPLDALVVVNRLNRGTDDSVVGKPQFHDVDDDSRVTPLDALVLINDINARAADTGAGGPLLLQSSVLKNAATGTRVRVELETEGAETELKIRLDNAPVSSSFEVMLNDIALGQLMTDARGRGQIVLSQGDDNRDHAPLPPAITSLSPEMELIIGDIVRGQLSQIASVENHNSNVTGPGASESQELHLKAVFPQRDGIQSSATYEREIERGAVKQKLEAEIENAAPNSVVTVTVNGVFVGNITTDVKGKGKLRLTSSPTDTGEQPLPPTFPVIAAGASIQIGSSVAEFRVVSETR